MQAGPGGVSLAVSVAGRLLGGQVAHRDPTNVVRAGRLAAFFIAFPIF